MNSVVIVAAGKGKRMNSNINKQYIKLKNKEIIAYTIDIFDKNENIDEIVVVIRKEEEFFVKQVINKYKFNKNVKIAYGGSERQDSVYNGIKEVDLNCDIVLIHDGARPFVTDEIINNSIKETKKNKAVVVGVPVKDTIKVIDDNNIIKNTPQRKYLWAVQTPQVFEYKLIKKAYEKAFEENYYGTDDATLVENLGYNVKMIMGSYKNIKITTKEDINFGEEILRMR
ncbi:2-C-methyl-D-erythritol 4-phosphate cytidylyltransferase [Tepidibacter formicigenes]|jgi:2-C-methyl-D-erythritol 4-phosphate cytidylyltransferase|uniref:2-C-methyl-D-erythritol 4-phosphate cytidylyltransferase n=1 Tax=Tepidibacter formicigenes DSM 15518 TaxID=1123349 RepID=A0A1M6QLJ0_9FIRM|nr:2-C-methyl-D-erythritol 4-phosphate cytidylyltransferase [Tepidibacter formicigenes]SHK21048.1 2-C-methyl-D-erythritol 4-phosphate cytidylyltransferase [Tepidibacter formicigenes DSM 15518]